MKSVTINTLQNLKQNGEKFAVLTAYDASMAHFISEAGVEVILVGDSLGNVVQGHDSTLPVTIEQMAYHTANVKRGSKGSLIIADMPFMSYRTADITLDNAMDLMQAGAHMVKLEGGEWLYDTFALLAERGIPACAHLGLTPQSVNKFGGYKVQGKDADQAQQITTDALALQDAGADLLVLECVPTPLARQITEQLKIPVIGIGAGPHTDGQVLVSYDMLGLTPQRPPKFAKNFLAQGKGDISAAFRLFVKEVKAGKFPTAEHSYK
jgi:3-methyl-2-oxobutanoate hydroxymethyltransferase